MSAACHDKARSQTKATRLVTEREVQQHKDSLRAVDDGVPLKKTGDGHIHPSPCQTGSSGQNDGAVSPWVAESLLNEYDGSTRSV